MVNAAASDRPRIACVLLAAGGSSRLGRPKQLARRRMRPLILHAIAAARGALDGAAIVVVLGASAQRLRTLLRRHAPDVRPVLNPHWHAGLATSLHAGLRALPRDADAVLVTLVDQPDVDAAALRRLLAAWRRRPACPAATVHGERPGVPAIFPRAAWGALREIRGDAGARGVLHAAAELTLVEMPEAAFDVDTPDDLAQLQL
jgi:molybdenum cofactor cytidylyltransferase